MSYVLADFDNHLMNGFEFCKRAYSVIEEIRISPNGIEKLRLRKGKLEKKLVEELLPIARYIQARYSHGRILKVRWIDGTQNYDARLLSSGYLADKGEVPKRQFIEVTTAVHEKDHIARDILNKTGHSFGVKGVKQDPQTGKYVSQPYVYTNHNELSEDLANRISQRIISKAKIKYPSNTSLVIQCFLDTLLFEGEWEKAIESVKSRNIQHRFCEIFVFDSNHHYTATLYGGVCGKKNRRTVR